ncbi:hypothetical protein QW060_25850 [Myroides ceti]|uniref:Mobile element protein n=1 Tax=Paenimyroides ceti TaxID=395087 RepID=A0ABT8D0E3_9FLAO|nr:hypothetical protein [Paenimyroides ceti]MDN3710269.1 hypothetical protein [Paenimyroides ceti]
MNTQLYNRLIIKVSLNEFSFGIKNKLNNEISHLKSISLNQLAPWKPVRSYFQQK